MIHNTWHQIYHQLAIDVDQFYQSYKENSGYQLYVNCSNHSEFGKFNHWIQNLSEESIDPIHIFATINQYGISDIKKIQQINFWFELVNAAYHVNTNEKINFIGIPAYNLVKILSNRAKKDQQQIWEFFHALFDPKNESVFDFNPTKDPFKLYYEWYGVGISVLTSFLFWVDSDRFLALDNKTQKLLLKYNQNISLPPESFKEYEALLTKNKKNLFRNLVHFAIDENIIDSLNEEEQLELKFYLNIMSSDDQQTKIISNKLPSKDNQTSPHFHLIGLKLSLPINSHTEIEKSDNKFLKTLKPDSLYILNEAYAIDENGIITYDSSKDYTYDLQTKIKIHISAIVGENGTGKSTIVEALAAITYLLAKDYGLIKLTKKEKLAENFGELQGELYFKIDTNEIYKIAINHTIQIFQYQINENRTTFHMNLSNIKNTFYAHFGYRFFYTIFNNYSIHSLNSNIMGPWINKLFHKNDGYQTPIVLEPMRTCGNFNINQVDYLAKTRFLATLLMPTMGENTTRVTETVDAEYLLLTFNKEKIINKIPKNFNIEKRIDNINEVLNYLLQDLDENIKISHSNIETYTKHDYIKLYIYIKVLSICKNYSKFKNFYSKKGQTLKDINLLIPELIKDPTHVTYKLKRAINYFKYKIYEESELIPFKDLSEKIGPICSSKKLKNHMELLPPSFFDVQIILNNKIPFDTLSSGEKQYIYTINSILYHLINLASIQTQPSKKIFGYKQINIVLDEIELYFHPNMQRNFISDLIHQLQRYEKMGLNDEDNIRAINIIFVTHSPYILSDIFKTNILALKKGDEKLFSVQKPLTNETFGAHIHKLLSLPFFMGDNLIGKYSESKISNLYNELTSILTSKKSDTSQIEHYLTNRDKYYHIAFSIGDDYLKNTIMNILMELDKQFKDNTKKISLLLKKIEENPLLLKRCMDLIDD